MEILATIAKFFTALKDTFFGPKTHVTTNVIVERAPVIVVNPHHSDPPPDTSKQFARDILIVKPDVAGLFVDSAERNLTSELVAAATTELKMESEDEAAECDFWITPGSTNRGT